MAEAERTPSVPESLPVGHVELRLSGHRPVEVPFLFEYQQKRLGEAFGVSFLTHVVLTILAIVVVRYAPQRTTAAFVPERAPKDIVWLAAPGPGGGGGGGGNESPEPPQKAELPGREKLTVPVEKPVALSQPDPKDEPTLEQQLNIPAKTLGAEDATLPGVIEGTSAQNLSQGPGTGGGAGTGTGTGIGSGSGPGLGAGWGGGTGGGAYRPGNGVTLPRILREVKPQYTADAMRAKIQGEVWLEAVVLPDGVVGQIEVIRSLDPTFGLDQEAVKAARQWRFIPGTRFGEPVPVLVTIQMQFTLR
jgi:TonB family protein